MRHYNRPNKQAKALTKSFKLSRPLDKVQTTLSEAPNMCVSHPPSITFKRSKAKYIEASKQAVNLLIMQAHSLLYKELL